MSNPGPNAEFISCWNDILEPKFNRFREILVRAFGEHSRGVITALGPGPGERAIDVGCAWGDTTLELARQPGVGAVLGIDCVERFLDHGRRIAAQENLRNVRFVLGDAQTYRFEPGYDLVFSRFGTLYFAGVVAALRNLGRATRPDGRLVMLVWRSLAENAWLAEAKAIALRHLPPPGEEARTCGPGPFSMADPEVLRMQLEGAGWREPMWRAIDVPVQLGTIGEAIEIAMALGPAGEIIREAGALAEAKRERIADELRAALGGYVADGEVVMPSASWCVTARWPG